MMRIEVPLGKARSPVQSVCSFIYQRRHMRQCRMGAGACRTRCPAGYGGGQLTALAKDLGQQQAGTAGQAHQCQAEHRDSCHESAQIAIAGKRRVSTHRRSIRVQLQSRSPSKGAKPAIEGGAYQTEERRSLYRDGNHERRRNEGAEVAIYAGHYEYDKQDRQPSANQPIDVLHVRLLLERRRLVCPLLAALRHAALGMARRNTNVRQVVPHAATAASLTACRSSLNPSALISRSIASESWL